MRNKTRTNLNIIALCAISVFGTHALAVTLPAGSVDQLAAAIAEAGPGGEVVLAAGVHKISGTVIVDIPVSIIGEDGAILESGTSPVETYPYALEAALHIKDADGVRVQNLSIQPAEGATANTGIVVENAMDAQIVNNRIIRHQQGILVHHGDRALLKGNAVQIVSDPAYAFPAECGIVVVNGRDVTVQDNRVSGATLGIWLGSHNGDASGNTTQGGFVGFLLCTPVGYTLSGEPVAAEAPATAWIVYQNTAVGNSTGYLVMDGANNNFLLNNSAALNGAYDVEVAGETSRWGVLLPTSLDNTVVQGLNYERLKVKVCGTNNQAHGNVILVDTTLDPCF